MTVLLVASADAVPDGADFDVPADAAFIVSIYKAPGAAMEATDCVWIDIKTDNEGYTPMMQLGGGNPLVAVLPAVGSEVTYRCRKPATSVAIGVDGR